MVKKLFTSDYQPMKRGKGPQKGIRPLKKIIEMFLFSDIEWQDIDGKPKKMQVVDVMVANQVKRACKDGDLASFKDLMDRYFGKPKDELHHAGNVTVKKMMFGDMKSKTNEELTNIINEAIKG
ncbi:hypothetical protein ACFL49_00630 [Candidatus Omnitrophota bacterium]